LTGVVAILASRCGDKNPITPDPPPPVSGPAVLVGAADVADCGPGAESTAALLDGIPGTIFVAGDLAYQHGSARNFADCYDPTWGRHRSRTRPVPGNHEYESPGAAPYFDYFGDLAGVGRRGYYAFNVGSWKVLALNSEVNRGPGSEQLQWIRSELSNSPADCTIAMWHRPLYTSGPNLPNTDMREMFRLVHELGVEIVLNGHDHLYERFAPQDADGRVDPVRGVRQFTVGTGGTTLYAASVRPGNTEVLRSVWGVLKLTLSPGSYQWQFVPAFGSTFSDSGQGVCH
jgi:hypothetical protein